MLDGALAQQHADGRRERIEQLGTGADAVAHRGGGPHVEQLHAAADALFDAAPQALGLLGAGHRRAGEHDAREAAAAEPIFVVHRRLVDEIGELAFGAERPVAEEHEVAAAHDRERHVVARRRGRAASRRPTCRPPPAAR